jgi:hypothetical protein
MAASQSILWTTLPNGRITLPSGRPALRVSIFVSPRLIPTSAQALKPFDLFLDWPATVAKLRFKLAFDGGGGGELTTITGEDPLDSALWKRLFDEATFVRGYSFTDLQNEIIRSFPAAQVLAFVQSIYGETASKFGSEFPPHGPNDTSPLTRLKDDLGRLSEPRHRNNLNKRIDELLKESKTVPAKVPGFSSAAEAAFTQASRFYDRKKKSGANAYREQPDPAYKAVPVKLPEFDFHQALAAFADYPRLMRRLGLVIDCAWPESAEMPLTGRVRVEVKSTDAAADALLTKDKPGWTAYALTRAGTTFRARAAEGLESELTRGQLDLRLVTDASPSEQRSPYLISQLDVDGSALKTLNTAGSLVRLDNPRLTNYRSPTHSDLPALRTSGLSLYRSQRAENRHEHFVRAAVLQTAISNGVTPAYFADDLQRGYRVDIWDDVSREWHPLCLRNGDYFLTKRGKMKVTLRDEGYVKSASAARGDTSVETDLYLHERLLSFDGWSLVASRPGKTLAADPATTAPVAPTASAATEFGLMTQFWPPAGTLPRLRFGRRYRMRVRLVDIAGNSVEFREAGDTFASDPIRFTRFEPVPSPALLLRARVTEGESLEHLVIRSDYDRTAKAYAVDPIVTAALEAVRKRLGIDDEPSDRYAYLQMNERHVAPPKTSQLEAEMHGRFDDFIGPGKDHAKGYRLASRESGSFLSKQWINLDTGVEEPIPGLDLEIVPATGGTRTNLDAPSRQPGDPLKEGEYVLHRETTLTVPYLPDPYAAGVAFHGLPGWPLAEPKIVLFKGIWPNVRPFRIRVEERPGVMNQCTQIFTDDGTPEIVEEGGCDVLRIFLPKGVSAEVRYSSVIPSEAEARNMSLWKWLEQRGDLTDDAKRNILAGRHWMFTPWRTMTLVHAVQHPLCAPTIKLWSNSRQRSETHTSLRGQWHLSAKSTSKILIQAEWLEPLDDVTKPTWQIVERNGNVAEWKISPTMPDLLDVPGPLNAIASFHPPLQHEFGDTKHRAIKYRLKGTTRFREYFPPEITHTDAAISRTGPEFTLHIPSSARPAAPQPLYILPTFRWEETALPNNGLSRTRRGNGLRVYLERPWWSSGQNERLGVVYRPGAVADSDKAYVTQWGLDPAFDSSAPTAGPIPDSFPLALEARSNASLEEKGNTKDVYWVSGHAVEFDPARKLWFSDIEVKAGGSYFPFIRLALARFQPTSVEDCHLSRVVQTDFVQLVPDRTLKLTWLSATRVRIQIFGQAPKETYVSRILAEWGITTTPSQARSAALPVQDLFKSPALGATALEFFKANQLEFIRADQIGTSPGTPTVVGTPAEPSSRAGLNEYTLVVERLPENESPDFGWQPIEGLTPTRPPTAQSSPAKFDPIPGAITTRSGTGGTKVATGTAAAVGKTAVAGTAAGNVTAGIEAESTMTVKPLWEGDLTLPVSNDHRPRRLVVREHELYFKAFSTPENFMPIARRLVYVDIVNLPGPVS